MKKWWLVLLGAGLFATAVFAESDLPVEEKRLPEEARSFLREHFGDIRVASAVADREQVRSYEVVLVDGTEIEFDARGRWKEVKANSGGTVPASVVPARILDFVARNQPERTVTGIEREGRRGYDVWLNNGAELEFDRNFRLIGMER